MPEKTPLISIVIPVKNGEPWLEKTMRSIFSQTLIDKTEVIIVDSGSTDSTFQILQKFPVRMIRIEPSEFNHGTTRNRGVLEARGEFIVMTVQDAEPTNERWLQSLLEGFDDEKVAGVCGLQIVPHDLDKNPVDWFRPQTKPVSRKFFFEQVSQFEVLASEKKQEICSWDNVNAMYRRKILLDIPFQPVSFAEDALWARDVIRNGLAIVYCPIAQVNHYHFETPDYAFKRNFTVLYHLYIFFGIKPSENYPILIILLRIVKLLVREKQLLWSDKWKWLLYNYQQQRAIQSSSSAFLEILKKGIDKLEIHHSKICGKAPQALNPQLVKI
jgi:rhamnosyltransferase